MMWGTDLSGVARRASAIALVLLASSILTPRAAGDLAGILDGLAGDWFGEAVSAGDVSGNLAADLLVGAPGANAGRGGAFLFLGGGGWTSNLTRASADASFEPPAWAQEYGSAAAVVRDIDGDGFGEVAVSYPRGSVGGGVVLFRGRAAWNGTNPASAADLIFADRGVQNFGVALTSGDVNGDGLGDLLIGSSEEDFANRSSVGAVWIVMGPGLSRDPVWAPRVAWDSPDIGNTNNVELGDLDGDGDLDLLAGNGAGFIFGYRNVAGPRWAAWTGEPAWDVPSTGNDAAPVLGDLDGDGDLDLWVGLQNGSVRVLENVGGRWGASWSSRPGWEPPPVASWASPALGDLDGDGDLDAMIADGNGLVQTLENTGTTANPSWAVRPGWDLNTTWASPAPSLSDLDHDGDLDLFLGAPVGGVSGRALGIENRGNVTAPTWAPRPAWDSPVLGSNPDPAVADLDGDGDPDLLLGDNTGVGHAYLNDQDAYLRVPGPTAGGLFGAAAAAGEDIDGDGVEDFVIGAPGGQGAAYLLRGGTRNETGLLPAWIREPSWDLGPTGPETSPEFADLDGDGDLDALVGEGNGVVYGYRNAGNSSAPAWAAEPAWDIVVSAQDTGPGLGDLDDDGDPDLLAGAFDGTLTGFRNLGNATAPAWSRASALDGPNVGGYAYVALGDLDLDGDLDALVGEIAGTVVGLQNQGNATSPIWALEPAWDLDATPYASLMAEAAPALAEFDGDGDLDLLLGSEPGSHISFENVGGPTSPRWIYHPNFAPLGDLGTDVNPALGDLDGDADTDLLVGEWNGNGFAYRNAPRFVRLRPAAAALAWGTSLGLGDFNGDGWTDVAVGAPGGSGTVDLFLGPLQENRTARPLPSVRFPGTGCGFGRAFAFARWNGDSVDDLAIGAACGGGSPDSVRFYLGTPAPPPTMVTSQATQWNSTALADGFGASLAFLRSVSGRGWVAVGAPGHDAGGLEAGRVFLMSEDLTPPTITILNPPDYAELAGEVPVTYAVSADAVAVEFRVYDGTWRTVAPWSPPSGTLLWNTSGWTGVGAVLWGTVVDAVGLKGEDSVVGLLVNPPPPPPGMEPPSLAGVPDLVVHYDYSYNFDLGPYVNDPDTPPANLTVWTSDPNHIWISPTNNLGLVLNFPASMLTQSLVLVIWVSDGTSVAFDVVNVTITTDYPPEVLRPLPDVSLDEDTVAVNAFFVNLDYYFLDIDGDNLYYTTGNRSVMFQIHPNRTVDIWADPDWFGFETVTLRATDPTGALVEDKFLVQVNPVDDAPTIAPLPDLVLRPGEAFSLDLAPYLADIDDPVASLVLGEDGVHAELVGTVLVLRYPAEVAAHSVTITASDGRLIATAALRVRVVGDGVPGVFLLLPVALLALLFGALAVRRRSLLALYEFDAGGRYRKTLLESRRNPVGPERIAGLLEGQDMERTNSIKTEGHSVVFLHLESSHFALVCLVGREEPARRAAERLVRRVVGEVDLSPA